MFTDRLLPIGFIAIILTLSGAALVTAGTDPSRTSAVTDSQIDLAFSALASGAEAAESRGVSPEEYEAIFTELKAE